MALRAAFHADAAQFQRFLDSVEPSREPTGGARPLSASELRSFNLSVVQGEETDLLRSQKELMGRMLEAGATPDQALRHAMVDMSPAVVGIAEVLEVGYELAEAEGRDVPLTEAREEALRRKRARLAEAVA